MRWNCPYCGIILSVKDEKMPGDWSYSRCDHCGGYALVKKARRAKPSVRRAMPRVVVHEIEESNDLVIPTQPPPTICPPPFHGQPRNNFYKTPIREAIALPDPLPEHPERKDLMQKSLPIAIGIMTSVALGSGYFLVDRGKAIYDRSWVEPTELESEEMENAEDSQSSSEVYSQPSIVASITPVVDEVKQTATAPVKDENMLPPLAPLAIRAAVVGTKVRSGPGTQYPILREATKGEIQIVVDWQGLWFKVLPLASAIASELPANAGWVRNDLVELIN